MRPLIELSVTSLSLSRAHAQIVCVSNFCTAVKSYIADVSLRLQDKSAEVQEMRQEFDRLRRLQADLTKQTDR